VSSLLPTGKGRGDNKTTWAAGIIEWFGLEGTFKGHLVQPPCSEQGHLQQDQDAQSPVQPDLECFHRWGLHHLSEEPVPGFRHTRKKFLPFVQSKSALPYFITVNHFPIRTGPAKKESPHLSYKPPLTTERLQFPSPSHLLRMGLASGQRDGHLHSPPSAAPARVVLSQAGCLHGLAGRLEAS